MGSISICNLSQNSNSVGPNTKKTLRTGWRRVVSLNLGGYMSNGGKVELLEMDELCLKEKDHRLGRANLNKYKLEIHVRILEDSHIIYRNVGESLRYILILGETYVLNVSDY